MTRTFFLFVFSWRKGQRGEGEGGGGGGGATGTTFVPGNFRALRENRSLDDRQEDKDTKGYKYITMTNGVKPTTPDVGLTY